MSESPTKTILSLEQALTLPYATQRFVQLGWRVIRIENTGGKGDRRAGDPNRYIGEDTGVDDLHTYFIAPNVGKEAITLNLKKKGGQELLRTIIRELGVDVFLCNTLPKRYTELGIDYATLKKANPDLIWCGVSALGPDYPNTTGYDPTMQALVGYMYLTGEPDRDPMLCGLPIVDLKAGDEAFAQVLLALMEQERAKRGGRRGGKEIHISMTQCAASWLITALPHLQFTRDPSRLPARAGNEHRNFIPCKCYRAKDGHVFLAIGSDRQWQKLTEIKGFEHLGKEEWKTNEGRRQDKEDIYAGIGRGLEQYTVSEFIEVCFARNLPVAPISSIHDVAELDFVKNNMVATHLPPVAGSDKPGRRIALFPAPVKTEFLSATHNTLGCAPRLGEHNEAVLREAGFIPEEIKKLREDDVI
ncbi:MAG: CoA transferase [Candidatus Krumholzibacteria bacterium]|nr:CoA transferase [Candidatus Krumholzibacteria bacterium]